MKKGLRWLLGLFVLLVLGLGGAPVYADVPDRPVDTTVLDETGILSSDTISQIDMENRSWKSTDLQLQVGVYMVDSLSSDIESLSNEVFRKWQVGFSGTNNGVLLVIALEDRKFRIETSDMAATVLTDTKARRILEDARSFFREGDYNGGVLYIVDAIGDTFYGTSRAQAQLEDFEREQEESDLESLIFFILGVLFIVYTIRKGGRGGRGGPGSFLWILSDSYRSSHSDSSSSSSGFGGGGWSGGGGGGGGASSGW